MLLSPTKEGLQQHLDLLHRFCQTWALTVNLSKTKIMVFQKRSSCQDHKCKFHLDTVAREHTKKDWGQLTNHEFTKWDKHQIETLHAEFCKNILRVQRRTPNNACRAELGRYPLIIKIQRRAVKFYNNLKGSDSQTFHNKAITYREINLEKNPLSKLVLGLCSQTQTHPTEL